MHVAFAIDGLGSGGAQRQAVELARALRRDPALRVSFLVYHDVPFYESRLREAGVGPAKFVKRFRLDPTVPLRIARWIARERPDVVHSFLLRPSLVIGAALALLPRRARPVWIAAERSALIATTRALELEQRLVYGRCDAVTANARAVADELVQRLRVPVSAVHYLPNGIDLADWDLRAAAAPPAEPEAGMRHLALVGGLRPEKGHDVLLRAFARCDAALRARWKLWLVGAETGGPDAARRVHESVSRARLAATVRFLDATPAIAALLARMDALVLPSLYEGFPNVLLEAMASRLPTIASAVGDVPEMIEHGVTGWIVPPGDVEALTRVLADLDGLAPDAAREMGRRARATVEARWRIEAVAGRTAALYRSLCDRRAAGEP